MEKFELVDINGNKTGTIINVNDYKGSVSIPEGEYIPVVKVAIVNKEKKVLLQKRSMNKVAHPGQWGLNGGKVNAGEDTLTTAVRETFEEIGIKINKEELKFLCQYIDEKGIFTIYYIEKNVNIEDCKIQTEELDRLEYFELDEISKLIIEGTQWVDKLKAVLYKK